MLKWSLMGTIRRPRKIPINIGDRLYLYTGLRTKQCKKLGEGICIETRPIQLTDIGIIIDGDLIPRAQADLIAQLDGLDNYIDLKWWFKIKTGEIRDMVLIRWRYVC